MQTWVQVEDEDEHEDEVFRVRPGTRDRSDFNRDSSGLSVSPVAVSLSVVECFRALPHVTLISSRRERVESLGDRHTPHPAAAHPHIDDCCESYPMIVVSLTRRSFSSACNSSTVYSNPREAQTQSTAAACTDSGNDASSSASICCAASSRSDGTSGV